MLNLRSQVVSPNVYPAVVVYDRPSGVTAADKAKATADAAKLRRGRRRRCRPGHRADHRPPTARRWRPSCPSTWAARAGARRGPPPTRCGPSRESGANGMTVHITGPLGTAADSGNAFKGIDGTLLFSALAVVIVLLLLTYRSPVALAAAGHLRRRGADHRAGGHLPAGRARGADRQRAERGHPRRAGVRRGDRLRAAAHRPVPGGTAPARGPARGDGGRAAPGRARRRGQRRNGDPQPADPVARRAELHQEHGAGARHRRRGRAAAR